MAALLVVTAVALRVLGLDERPLFRDEAASWLEARYPLTQLLEHAAGEPYPPLYALLLHVWLPLVGDSEAALRSLSVLPGLALLLVVWRWAHEALGRWAGLVALAVVAFSPLAIANARDARMYAWEALFATTAWWLIWRLLSHRAEKAGGRRSVAWHGLLLALAVGGELWTLALGIVVAGWQALVVVAAVIVDWWGGSRAGSPASARSSARARSPALAGSPAAAAGSPAPAGSPARARWPASAGSIVGLAAVLAGWLSFVPWLPRMIAAATSGAPYWTPIPGLFDWVLTARVALVGWRDDTIVNLAVTPLLVLAVAGVAGLLRSIDPARRRLGWTVLAAAALVPSVWAVSQVRSIYDHRYFGALVGPLALGLAAGASGVGGLAVRWARDRRRGMSGAATFGSTERRGIVVALGLVCVLTAPFASEWLGASRSEGDGSPVRALIREIAPRMHAGDSVLAVDARAYFPVAYELARASPTDPRLAVPVLHWVSGSEPHYNGWTLIDEAENVDDPALRRDGTRAALRLGPEGRLWLIASGADAGGTIDITLVHELGVRQLDRLVLGADRSEPAQAVLLEIPGP